jgi:uncharacterized membrane protein YphA (DoxX/SURF4 family)
LRRYFLVEGSPVPLALFRIVLGISVAIEASQNFKRVAYYTPQTLHFSYLDIVAPLPAQTMETLFAVQLVCAIGLTLGLLTRLSAAGVLLTQGYAFLVCALNFRNHVYLELLLTFILLFSACGAALSLDSVARRLWRARRAPAQPRTWWPHWVPITAQRVVGLQICCVYLYAALHKLTPGFLSGYPLGTALARAVPRSTVLQWILDPAELAALAQSVSGEPWSSLTAWLTVGAEGFLAVGLLFKPTRIAAVMVGVGMHLGIGVTMDIVTFGLVMTGAYICFWTPRTRPQTPGTGARNSQRDARIT